MVVRGGGGGGGPTDPPTHQPTDAVMVGVAWGEGGFGRGIGWEEGGGRGKWCGGEEKGRSIRSWAPARSVGESSGRQDDNFRTNLRKRRILLFLHLQSHAPRTHPSTRYA